MSEPSASFQRNFCVVSCAPCLRTSSRRCSEYFFAQLFAQRFGQIRHGVPVRGAAGVKPFEQLRDAIGRLAPAFELRLQFLARQGFDVGRHRFRLNRAGKKTKQTSIHAQFDALLQAPQIGGIGVGIGAAKKRLGKFWGLSIASVQHDRRQTKGWRPAGGGRRAGRASSPPNNCRTKKFQMSRPRCLVPACQSEQTARTAPAG